MPHAVFDTYRCEITAKEAVLLGPILLAAKGVVSLKLCYNHLRDGGAEAVSTAIERHPSLHTMDLGEYTVSLFWSVEGAHRVFTPFESCPLVIVVSGRVLCSKQHATEIVLKVL